MENTKETIAAKAYDLLKYSLPMLEGLPRSQKFTLGDRIQNHLSDLLEMLLEAYYLPAAEKRPLLLRANIRLEMLRYFYRLGFDRGHYNSLRYKEFAERIDEIGRMVGGWIKSLPAR
ncbi:MAG: diversity-generating retroelement protein Avd [Saprospiraceae bacterium]